MLARVTRTSRSGKSDTKPAWARLLTSTPALSSPNFLTTPKAKATGRWRCWKASSHRAKPSTGLPEGFTPKAVLTAALFPESARFYHRGGARSRRVPSPGPGSQTPSPRDTGPVESPDADAHIACTARGEAPGLPPSGPADAVPGGARLRGEALPGRRRRRRLQAPGHRG